MMKDGEEGSKCRCNISHRSHYDLLTIEELRLQKSITTIVVYCNAYKAVNCPLFLLRFRTPWGFKLTLHSGGSEPWGLIHHVPV